MITVDGLRRMSLGTLFCGAGFAAAALVYQMTSLGDLVLSDLPGLTKLLLLFWSPYALLMAVTVWLGRHRLRAAVLLFGSLAITVWGLIWHLDILFFRPDPMAQILSPLLIPGTQWLMMIGTVVLALLAGLIR